MKAKNNQSNPQLTGILFMAFPAAILVAAMPLSAQVVIEGGPGTIQISDRDGRAEDPNSAPAISSPVTAAVPVVPGGVVGDSEKSLSFEANALEGTAVSLPAMKKNEKSAPTGPVAAVTVVSPKVTQTNPATVKRLAELKRELDMQDTGSRAAVAITTKGLFKEETDIVDELSESRLQKIAEYLRLSEKAEVDVTYHYAATEEDKDSAWERSLSVVNWMEAKGQVSKDLFRLNDPVVSLPTPVRTNPQNPEDTEIVGWIEFSM